MRSRTCLVSIVVLLGVSLSLSAAPLHKLLSRKTDSGTVVGYKDTPPLASTGGEFLVHDLDRPVPTYVTPGRTSTDDGAGTAPSDALVLFDGGDLAAWKESTWKVVEGSIVAGEGSLETQEAFGDFQLHLEWMAPTDPPVHMMSRGNSGVMIMGQYEVQIFDSHPQHEEQIYADGQAASLYAQSPPLVNACRKPGEWQSFDIVFTAPEFEGEKLVKPAVVTVFHNGLLVHLNQRIDGPSTHCSVTPYSPHAAKLPLAMQGHSSPVRFRNVWIRPLDR